MTPYAESKNAAKDGLPRLETDRSKTARSAFGSLWRLTPYHYLPIAAFGGLLVGLLIAYSVGDNAFTRLPDPPSMAQCVADTAKVFAQKTGPTPEIFRDARDHCYSLIESHELFRDVAIRKLNFLQQYRANGVLMWMVVAVTFSGVLLAGLQLWASYQLATLNRTPFVDHNSEIIVKRDQLVLKSSITGLLILVISFCFFLVFVFYVYKFEIPSNRSDLTLPPSTLILPSGELGPPVRKKLP